jgi:hypothetical protein
MKSRAREARLRRGEDFAAAVGLELGVDTAHGLLLCGKQERTFIRTKIGKVAKSRFGNPATRGHNGQAIDMKGDLPTMEILMDALKRSPG